MRAKVTKDGLVETSVNLGSASTRTANTDAQVSTVAPNTQYAYEVTTITTEIIVADITTSASGFAAGDTSGQNTCTRSGSVWYCPILLANSNAQVQGNVVLDGYVAELLNLASASTRTTNSDAKVSTTLTSVKYSHKFTITTEIGASITPTTVTAGSSATSCSINSNVVYCPVPVAEDGGTNDIVIIKDGYVSHTSGDTGNRASNAAAQGAQSFSDVKYSYVVDVNDASDSNDITGATVTAGASIISCTESGGDYYCPVTLTNDGSGTIASAARSGFDSNIGTLSDRTANTDVQVLVTISLSPTAADTTSAAVGGGGGGGSVGSVIVNYLTPEVEEEFTEVPSRDCD